MGDHMGKMFVLLLFLLALEVGVSTIISRMNSEPKASHVGAESQVHSDKQLGSKFDFLETRCGASFCVVLPSSSKHGEEK